MPITLSFRRVERSEAGEPALSELERNLLFVRGRRHDMPMPQTSEVCIRARLQARRRGAEQRQPLQGRQRLAPDVKSGVVTQTFRNATQEKVDE